MSLGANSLGSLPLAGLPAAAGGGFQAVWALDEYDYIGDTSMKKNVASQVIGVQMVSATDGSAFTSTVSCVVTGDGGTQSAGGGAVTHEGNGFHTYTPTQAETNYDHVAFTFTGTGAIPKTVQVYTTFPQTGDSFARIGAPAGASVSADIATLDTVVDGIQTDLDNGTDGLGAIKTAVDAIPTSNPTAAAIADAVWDEASAGHVTAGTYGVAVTDILADTNELQTDDIPTTLATLATASALATVDANVDAILVDTGTTLETHLTDIKGATFSGATDSLEAIRDRGDAAWTTGAGGTPPQLLQNTTIATLASQTSFTLTAGSADDDAYNGAVVVVTDQSTSTQKAVGSVLDYTGSSKTVTLTSDPGIFTMAVGDTIDIIANASTAPTAADVADAVWDEVITGAQHNVTNSAARFLRESSEVAAGVTGTAQGSGTGNNQIQLASGAVSTNDIFNGERVTIIEGTGAGQSRLISDSVATTDTLTLFNDWIVLPSTDSVYAITGAEADVRSVDGTAPDIATATALATVDTNVDAILVDTNELQTDWANGGRLDLLIDAIKVVTDALPNNGALTDLATAAALATVDGNVDAILVDTDTTIPALIAALNDISVADVLTTQMTESYAADGTAPTLAQAIFLIQQFLFERTVAGTTTTIKQLDGTSTAATLTLNDATTPTSITRAT